MTQDALTENPAEEIATDASGDHDYWPRVAELTIEASLHDRRIHRPDITQAAEMAAQTFRSVLESKGYRVDADASVTYGYRAMRKRVG
jgi:hypothetical protein